MSMDREKCVEIFNKEIDSLMKHRHDSDFMLYHGKRTEEMICALTYAIKVLERLNNISFEPKGYRDVIWCPYLNEPAIIEYKDDKPNCPNCNSNYEKETHKFICHINKP